MDNGSKTEKATPKKRRDERKKGNIFSSKDIGTVLSLAMVFFTIKAMFPIIYKKVAGCIYHYINGVYEIQTLSLTISREILIDAMMNIAVIMVPIFSVSILAAVIGVGAQTRFLFSKDSLKPKFNRLNPLEGIKKIVSLKSFIEVLKGLIKITIIGYILYMFFRDRAGDLIKTLFLGIEASVSYVLNSVMSMVYMVCIVFVFIAGFDFLYQRWDYERQIRMTKQEVKEEYKQMEGDPKVKGKIKELQRKMAMSRMMQSVPDADVIIRNPTHYAVALKYDIKKDAAPYVVAKGQDELALRIVYVAEQNGVYVIENRELTRAIYAASSLDQEIPLEYYGAVAEILALVYRIREKNLQK
ncbi:flagellar biosynthesis protein FlhB [Sinanaerobacter sp. ZZT-01]|uniref:flagellar biosynthesis protein FlhB n=1 Tax=Sinanaerobacter sp. ZZT-01 TaxID=3111540 RepID=UPI002D79845B|nr:flagellar biosynthesis protein FlhB [Sinanaerobacter sp. ZZT-01]WRR93592.1 flagellar biosynthesis protein FlhB [Sinanaerobacter sp. ZZT-01]